MKVTIKPTYISPIPATGPAPTPRPVSLKRLSRLRMNWFAVGSVFGVGLSFFMNFVISAVVVPQYERVAGIGDWGLGIGKHAPKLAAITEIKPNNAPAAVQASAISPAQSPIPNFQSLPTQSPPQAAPAYPLTLALEVRKGSNLLDMLIANHVQLNEAHNVIKALKAKVNPGSLRAGQKISVTLARHETIGDKAAVKELAINLPNLSTVELARLQNGGFSVKSIKEELTTASYRGFGTVRSSLSQAAASGGIPSATLSQIVKAFSYDVDFQRDIHPGDTIEVLMERKVAKDGRVGGYGELRYAALSLHGVKKEIFRFKDGAGDYAWYDAKGNSIKRSLLRTPVDAVHITSGFGMRTHPIMGYSKMHRGVDFGASTGTPIMAAGDGVVEFKGWKNGYGNFVVIQHNATYETAYGHISRFGNIKVGGRVKQGQVIAYVGMTGMATGPHLHYEVLSKGEQVNPVAKQFNMATGLSGKALASFKANKANISKELASLVKPNAQLASR